MSVRDVNIVHIVINEDGAVFDELIELITDCLEQLGHAVRRSTNTFDANRLNLLIGHTAFLKEKDYDTLRGFGSPYVVFQMEALNERAGFAPDRALYLQFLTQALQVWDYAPENLPFLEAHGCRSTQYVPLGYSKRLERIVHAPLKDIDVLFYGTGTPRRQHVVETLRDRGAGIETVTGYGPRRDEAIARSKIVLNLHQFETTQLEQVRLSYLLNNRCFVVSESAESNPYGDGVLFSEYDHIVDCCISYLRPEMESRRAEVADAGYASLKAIPTVAGVRTALQRLGVARGG
jgi:hypothetical protein